MNDLAWNESGLVAAIIQDDSTAAVLMLGWMNPEALRLTEETGRVHLWSRSRQELWEKGATSGNFLDVVSVTPDCDGDALLVRTHPRGPTCHTGTTTCWGDYPATGVAILDELWGVIAERAASLPAGSYTTSLLTAGGPEVPGRKVVEEAMEVLLAAKDHYAGTVDDTRVAEEAADLVYHLLVLLTERGISPRAVLDVLATRRK